MESSSQMEVLASVKDSCVTLYVPTHKFGSGTVSDASHFTTLLNTVSKELIESGLKTDTVRDILDPVEQLVSPASFWQNRSEGLAVFAQPGTCRYISLPYSVAEQVHIGTRFHLRQSLPYLLDDSRFFVLALSKNLVRLFEGTRDSLVPINDIEGPSSMEEALQFEDPEHQLQGHSVGGGELSYHGHGSGDEIDKETLERYLRAVDKGVTLALRDQTAPLVLASVPYYLPIYASMSGYPHVFGEAIEGSADHQSDKDLHLAAIHLLRSHFERSNNSHLQRFQDLIGTGLVIDDLEDIAEAAASGRVKSLFLSSSQPSENELEEGLVNIAIVETVAHAGSVAMDLDSEHSGKSARALLRF